MEEAIYTKEEHELFGLIKWTIEQLQKNPFINGEGNRTSDDYIRLYKEKEEQLIKLANKRYEELKMIEEEHYRNLYIYQDVTCPKCNLFTSLIPVGQEVNTIVYSCTTFECPKCFTIFSNNLPVLVSDKLKHGDSIFENMKKIKLPAEEIKAFKDSNDRLRRAYNVVEKSIAEIISSHTKLADYVKKNITDLTEYKVKVLAWNQPEEIN